MHLFLAQIQQSTCRLTKNSLLKKKTIDQTFITVITYGWYACINSYKINKAIYNIIKKTPNINHLSNYKQYLKIEKRY